MNIHYKLADIVDIAAMIKVGSTLFDYSVNEDLAKEFLADPRHHLFLAYDGEELVGMASGFHYIHPDKKPQLFVNEVAVLSSHENHGIGRILVRKLVDYARATLNCTAAWVATMESNLAAQKAFLAAGGKEEDERVVLIEY